MCFALYSVHLRHDTGSVRIRVCARNKKAAAQLVCDYDRAPLRAVISVRRLKSV